MQWLQTAYTVWFNRRHHLSGHLFGGRYKAVLIDEGGPQGKMLYGYVGTVLDYLDGILEARGFRERLLALLSKSDADVPLGQGQHYQGAALMREAAEQKAETALHSRTAHRGLDRRGT
jgi:hypothetical protein